MRTDDDLMIFQPSSYYMARHRLHTMTRWCFVLLVLVLSSVRGFRFSSAPARSFLLSLKLRKPLIATVNPLQREINRHLHLSPLGASLNVVEEAPLPKEHDVANLSTTNDTLSLSTGLSSSLNTSSSSSTIYLTAPQTSQTAQTNQTSQTAVESSVKKRWQTGALLALGSIVWVSCPTPLFTLGWAAISSLALDEYARMMHRLDIQPALRTARVLIALFYASSLWLPQSFHSLLLAATVLLSLVAHLASNQRPAQALDVISSIFGVLYLGYFPSHWANLHGIASPWLTVQIGKLLTVWTFLTVIASDAGGYFVGRSVGKHRLSSLSYAAGLISPKKTVEGMIGGLIASLIVSLTGAWLLLLPNWQTVGASFAIIVNISAVLGDLLASALKRSAQCKDSGDLLPGHGGVLDRIDSHLISGAIAFHFLVLVGLVN